MFRSQVIRMEFKGLAFGGRVFLLFCLVSSVCAQVASIQTSSVSFAYPPAEATGKPRLTINVLDSVDVEWTSNYGQTWLYLWCDEYKDEDGGKMVTYQWLNKEVFASGDTKYRPWDALESDTNNRTGKYPYSCHFELIYNNEDRQGILGTNLNITSRAGETIATTFARRATQIGTTASTAPTSLSIGVSQTGSTTSSPTATASATSSSSSSPELSNDTNSLSTGAKAGIAIGTVLAMAAVAAVGYLFYRNHRKIKELEARAQAREVSVEPKGAPTEYYRQEYQPVPPSELDQQITYELPAQPQELSGVAVAKK